MSNILCKFTLLSSVLATAQVLAVDIDSRPLAPDIFELTVINTNTTDITGLLAAVMPAAKKICGKKEALVGYYGIGTGSRNKVADQSSHVLKLTAEVRCGTIARERIRAGAASSTYQASEEDAAEVERMTYKFLNNKDNSKYQNAFIMFSLSLKTVVDSDKWQENVRAFNLKAGNPINRQIVKITWYNNTGSSADLGIFAVVEYVSLFENIGIHCGYAAWQQNRGKYQLVREEENYVDKATLAKLSAGDVEKLKTQFACAQ